MKIKLVDLSRQYISIKDEIDAAIQSCIDQTRFIGGEPVSAFAKNFADYCETSYCATCGNGTDALEIILRALGIGLGDEVIVPAFTFFATVEAVVNVGARPVLADIDPDRYTITAEEIQKRLSNRTKAVIVVHLYGQMADMDPILELARLNNILVVEDAAQAHGATYKGRKAGSFGVAGAFSFYPGKNLGAYGDAGAIVTNEEELWAKCSKIANHGRISKYNHELFGRNSRMDSIQAAILNVKLKYLDQWNEARRSVAGKYREVLEHLTQINPPKEYPDSVSVYHLFVIRVAIQKRSSLIKFMKENDIEVGIHYPISMRRIDAILKKGTDKYNYPFSDRYMNEVLSLPCFPELKSEEILKVSKKLSHFYKFPSPS